VNVLDYYRQLADQSMKHHDLALDEAVENIRDGINEAVQLYDSVLRVHRLTHDEINPRFCTEACRLAAGFGD
jgi:hypothetical protein